MTTERVPQIFLCHASEDKGKVRQLYHQLREAGLNPWFDEENILPGEDWDSEIRKAIRDSDFFLACLSNASVDKRGYFQKEIKIALDVLDEMPEGKVFLIPARLEECPVPDRLRNRQWVDLFGFRSRGFSRLLLTIASQHPSFAHSMSVLRDPTGESPFHRREGSRLVVKEPWVDWNALSSCLQKGDWEGGSEETLSILRFLAGHHASSRGYIRTADEVRRVPCSELHRLYHLWATLGEPARREKRPCVFVPRVSEIEGKFEGEMDLIADRLRNCGLEPFIWYMRPDGEILLGPTESWFDPAYRQISKECPPGLGVLQLCAVLCSLFPVPKQVLSHTDLTPTVKGPAAARQHHAPDAVSIDHALQVLAERSLIYGLGADSFRIHRFVDNLVYSRMDDDTVSTWVSRAIHAMDRAFPEPSNEHSSSPDTYLVLQVRFAAGQGRHGARRLSSIWSAGWEGESAASLLYKLAVHTQRQSRHVGWQDEADGYFRRSLEILSKQHDQGHPQIRTVATAHKEFQQSILEKDSTSQ